MKIQTIKTDVKKSQEFETVNYGVSTDNLPLLFQMLRTNLYSDIYGSIIREIASNVMDSHIEAGKPDAVGEIEWINENRLLGVDAQLIIRDFGVGLSPERMKTVYGNYLSSTKRDSNDQTGGFGLGSKVPFAYTDSFFVKTVFEGTEYKYLCYIDETQLGAISLLEKKETTRQNGTEIIVPAKMQYDKSTFQHSIFAQLTYFKNFNYININGPKAEVKFENEHCIIANQSTHSNLHIVLGTVAYPIDFDALGLNRYGFLNCYVGLKFNVGELQPTLSRESLFWNDSVKKKVLTKLEKAKVSIRKEIEKEISNEKDYAKWYVCVSNKVSKTFSNQWSFANVGEKATFTTASGETLQIKSRLDHWFVGFGLKLVTPYRNYSRRSKTKISKNLEYSTSNPSYHDLQDLPIYSYAGTLSARKALFLFKTYPKGFIVVKNYGLENVEDKKSALPYYNEGLTWFDTLKDFDLIEVPEDEFTETSDVDYKEAYKKILAERKLQGKFTARIVNIANNFGRNYLDSLTFNMYEGKFEEQKDFTIIYGTQENTTELYKAAAMLCYHKPFYGHTTFKNLKVYKISQSNIKQFKLMTNAHHVTDFLEGKTSLNTKMADIYSAIKINENIETYRLFKQFGAINIHIKKTYQELVDFVSENGSSPYWGAEKEILEFCTTHKLSNQVINDKMAEVKTYFENAGLLSCIDEVRNCEKELVEYLQFKGLKTNLSEKDLV